MYFIAPTEGVADFNVGTARSGESVLIGILYPGLVAVFFDASGVPVRVEVRELDPDELRDFRSGKTTKQALRDLYRSRLSTWEEEIGFTPRGVSVKAFSVCDGQIGVRGMPREFAKWSEAVAGGLKPSSSDLSDEVNEWVRSGMFVLQWGKEYFMDKAGDIDST